MGLPKSTARMVFRPWLTGDREALLSICRQELVMRFIDGPWDDDRVSRFIKEEQQSLANDGVCRWAVWHKQTMGLMGFCGFVRSESALEMGWRFDPEYWRQGYGAEAAKHMIDWAFVNTEVELIYAQMHVLNEASYALAEKVGMERIARVPVAECDDFRYEIKRQRWNTGH